MPYKKLQDLLKHLQKFNLKKGKCFFQDCNEKAIGSHTISEQRVLKILEEKDSRNAITILHLEDAPHVDFRTKKFTSYHNSERKLIKRGKSESSVFYGFCETHDREFFIDIDNYIYQNSNKVNFLHAYRAFALYFSRANEQFVYIKNELSPLLTSINPERGKIKGFIGQLRESMEIIPDDFDVKFELVQPAIAGFDKIVKNEIIQSKEQLEKTLNEVTNRIFEPANYPMKGRIFKNILNTLENLFGDTKLPKEFIGQIEEGISFRLNENENIADKFNFSLSESNFDILDYFHRFVPGVFKIAGNFIFHHSQIGLISVTIIPEVETSKTHILFSSMTSASTYFSQLNIMEDEKFEKYISAIIINQGTNIFFSNSYWESLGDVIRNQILSTKKEFVTTNTNLFKSNDG